MQMIETIPQKYIHNQFNHLIDTVKTQSLNQEQLINNIQLVEKSILAFYKDNSQTEKTETVWDEWFEDGKKVSDDFMNERVQLTTSHKQIIDERLAEFRQDGELGTDYKVALDSLRKNLKRADVS